MPWWIAALNSLAAAASIGFAIAALIRPTLLARPAASEAIGRFYPAMYAARAIPLGGAVAAVVCLGPPSTVLIILLLTAAAAQLGDLIIGAAVRTPGMVAGAAVGVLCHLSGVVALVR